MQSKEATVRDSQQILPYDDSPIPVVLNENSPISIVSPTTKVLTPVPEPDLFSSKPPVVTSNNRAYFEALKRSTSPLSVKSDQILSS